MYCMAYVLRVMCCSCACMCVVCFVCANNRVMMYGVGGG